MGEDIQKLFIKFIDYCRYTKRLRSETIRSYVEVFKTFSKIMPEIVSAQSLTPEMMTTFFKRIQVRERVVGKTTIKTGVRDSTIKTYHSKLNVFFQWLYLEKYLQENPLWGRKPAEPIYDDKRALERGDISKILSAITLHSPSVLILRRDLAMVNLLMFCGLRKGELVSLQVRDIDMEKNMLTIRGETSKSKKTHEVPIHPTLRMHLSEYIKVRNMAGYKTPFFIVSANNHDRGLSTHGVKHWVERLIKLSGVKFHIHRFRHTFATNLAKGNTGPVKIQKLMGHADIRMTMTYLRSLGAEDSRVEINKLNMDNF